MDKPRPKIRGLLSMDQLMCHAGTDTSAIATSYGCSRSHVTASIRALGLQTLFGGRGKYAHNRKPTGPDRYCKCGDMIPRVKGENPARYASKATCGKPTCREKKKSTQVAKSVVNKLPNDTVKTNPVDSKLSLTERLRLEYDRRTVFYHEYLHMFPFAMLRR